MHSYHMLFVTFNKLINYRQAFGGGNSQTKSNTKITATTTTVNYFIEFYHGQKFSIKLSHLLAVAEVELITKIEVEKPHRVDGI